MVYGQTMVACAGDSGYNVHMDRGYCVNPCTQPSHGAALMHPMLRLKRTLSKFGSASAIPTPISPVFLFGIAFSCGRSHWCALLASMSVDVLAMGQGSLHACRTRLVSPQIIRKLYQAWLCSRNMLEFWTPTLEPNFRPQI